MVFLSLLLLILKNEEYFYASVKRANSGMTRLSKVECLCDMRMTQNVKQGKCAKKFEFASCHPAQLTAQLMNSIAFARWQSVDLLRRE